MHIYIIHVEHVKTTHFERFNFFRNFPIIHICTALTQIFEFYRIQGQIIKGYV